MHTLNEETLIQNFDKLLNSLYRGRPANLDMMVDAVSFLDHPHMLPNSWLIEEHIANSLWK